MGKAVIAIHGGAGAISRAQMSLQQELRYIEALSAIVETGRKCWKRAKVHWMW